MYTNITHRKMFTTPAIILIFNIFSIIFLIVNTKYLEGELHTHDNWAFLARFCFLSEEGQFEYHLEYNEEQGTPNLLLYYDTEDQWPAVYKSSKTCFEREAVLHVEQNQVINLTLKTLFHKELSGCLYDVNPPPTVATPKYTLNVPKWTRKPTKKNGTTTTTTTTTAATTLATDETTTIFSTTQERDVNYTFVEDFDVNGTTDDVKADVEVFEGFTISGDTHPVPIKKRAVPYRFGNREITCHNARRFRSSRERWWFIAVSNCNGTKGIHLKYKLLMTNGPPGDYWHEHFSADEFYILPVLMAFSIAYSLLMLGIIMCSIELKQRQLLHTTYKIFVFSAIFQLIGIILSCAAYLKYAMHGFGGLRVRRMGFIMMGTSETLFLLLLLLLAKGFTITRGRLPLAASVKLTIFMCLYVITYISIVIYEANVFDPGEVLYVYESPAGYGLILLRIIAWCMFIYSTIFTLKHYPEKANFYYPFNVCGTLWFIAGPAFILSANTYIDKWVRESVVCAVLQFITFGGHLMFLILTMPSVANKNFPYHVRTTQIGIMELTGGATGASRIEQFGHHAYEPTGTVREQTLIVPLTRRTEEIFEGMYSHAAPRRTTHEGDDEEEIRNNNNNRARDVMLENVMNWSLAKNVAAIELPNFERYQRGSFASTESRHSADSLPNSRRHSEQQEIQENTFQDYVREVPIELFTISRMIVTNNSNNNTSNNNEINNK